MQLVPTNMHSEMVWLKGVQLQQGSTRFAFCVTGIGPFFAGETLGPLAAPHVS